ncbi:MAG: hypothetical protein V1800_17795, partial [Candidatus Latescibacterota bacterium]
NEGNALRAIIEHSLAAYRVHFRLFSRMTLIGELPAYVGTVIFLSAMGRSYALGMEPVAAFLGTGWKVIGGALALFGLMLSSMFLVAIADTLGDPGEERSTSVLQAFRGVSLGKALTVLLAFILVMMGISIGMMFFIVPGILLAVWFYLSPYAIVMEEAQGFDAFRRSRQLVRGHGGMVFWVLAASFGTELAGSLVIVGLKPFFGTPGSALLLAAWDLLIAPFQILLMIFLYDHLRNAEIGEY